MVIVEDAPQIPAQDQEKLNNEIERLYSKLSKLGWTREVCEQLAPFTLRINTLKEEKGIKILAHSYQSPEIIGQFVTRAVEQLKEGACDYCGQDSSALLADMFDIIDND